MFKIQYSKSELSPDSFDIVNLSSEEIPREIMDILVQFENSILSLVDNHIDFPFLQGYIKGNKLFNQVKAEFGLESKDLFFISNHPNYLGTDLINNYLDSLKTFEVYFVFVAGEMADGWLNSKVSKSHLIEITKKMLSVTEYHGKVDLNILEIIGSDKFSLVQSNPGSRKIRWRVKKI